MVVADSDPRVAGRRFRRSPGPPWVAIGGWRGSARSQPIGSSRRRPRRAGRRTLPGPRLGPRQGRTDPLPWIWLCRRQRRALARAWESGKASPPRPPSMSSTEGVGGAGRVRRLALRAARRAGWARASGSTQAIGRGGRCRGRGPCRRSVGCSDRGRGGPASGTQGCAPALLLLLLLLPREGRLHGQRTGALPAMALALPDGLQQEAWPQAEAPAGQWRDFRPPAVLTSAGMARRARCRTCGHRAAAGGATRR